MWLFSTNNFTKHLIPIEAEPFSFFKITPAINNWRRKWNKSRNWNYILRILLASVHDWNWSWTWSLELPCSRCSSCCSLWTHRSISIILLSQTSVGGLHLHSRHSGIGEMRHIQCNNSTIKLFDLWYVFCNLLISQPWLKSTEENKMSFHTFSWDQVRF